MVALFREKPRTWGYDVVREGQERVLRVNCEDYFTIPSLEEDPLTMLNTINILTQVKEATKIIYSQKRDYEYELSQTLMLVELASLIQQFHDQKKKLSLYQAVKYPQYGAWFAQKQNYLDQLLYNQLKKDPIGTYVHLTREIREEQIAKDHISDDKLKDFTDQYISILRYIQETLGKTQIINKAKSKLAGHKVGDREIYKDIFRPMIKPAFMYTKLQAQYPENSELLDTYSIDTTEVNVFKLPDTIQYQYHMMPPEFRLSENKYQLLDAARTIMAEHQPTREEFVDPEQMREVFTNVGTDLLRELAQNFNTKLTKKELDELAQILVRYTVGFGPVELLMRDEKIQDVSINSPLGRQPIYIVHSDFADCVTNIVPTRTESESWATKLRLMSGRPLDEANPILDTELMFPYARVRVSAVAPPLNPTGLSFSFRRHRSKPWTLPLFMKVKMINSLGAGLLSFLIDGSKTMLISGTRSSGKSSFLTSMMLEIMRRYRIITIEDTLELPVDAFRKMNYNILSLNVASALGGKTEGGVDASTGIRSTLRLGDSSLIVGEVRSKEAVALYEAMRIGAAANVVAGTIHADSPYGVFDRVVNDIGVPKTSFKATDIIVQANPVRSPDGIHRMRRITSITEVRKDWDNDPHKEKGFVELMKYNPHTDQLEPTPDLINGDSDILKSIAGNVKQWAGNWDAVWENIQLRAKIKQLLLDSSERHNDHDLLESDFVVKANDEFHNISDDVLQDKGILDTDQIYNEFERWLSKEIKKRRIK